MRIRLNPGKKQFKSYAIARFVIKNSWFPIQKRLKNDYN